MTNDRETQTARRSSLNALISLVAVMAMIFTLFMTQAPTADASPVKIRADEGRTTHQVVEAVVLTTGGTSSPDNGCSFNALGSSGGCYAFVHNLRDGSCPSGSILDGNGQCRRPLPDDSDVCILSSGYVSKGMCDFTLVT